MLTGVTSMQIKFQKRKYMDIRDVNRKSEITHTALLSNEANPGTVYQCQNISGFSQYTGLQITAREK